MARTKKVAAPETDLAKILKKHESEGEITTTEVEPGRFITSVAFDDPIMPELADDLIAAGIEFTAPELDAEEEELIDDILTDPEFTGDDAEPETPVSTEPAKTKTKTLDADLVALVTKTFESAEVQAVREAQGACAAIRAVALLHPTVPVAEFKAAAVSVGINAATAGIQRRAALNAARS